MTRTRTRYAIAMTVVMAAALCADRSAIAAPQVRPQSSSSMASRVMDRLSQSLRRVVPSVKVVETRRDGDAAQSIVTAPEPVAVQQLQLSPFQFRLPPPML